MKPEDYPLVEYQGQQLRRVPELPESTEAEDNRAEFPRCTMCVAIRGGRLNQQACSDLANRIPSCTGYPAYIYVPESEFTEYVVEIVRRRVSS